MKKILVVSIVVLVSSFATSCSSGNGPTNEAANRPTGSAPVTTSGKLDEAKAKTVLQQYLATSKKFTLTQISPFFPKGDGIEANYTVRDSKGYEDQGVALFRFAQDGKWYLAQITTRAGEPTYVNIEVK